MPFSDPTDRYSKFISQDQWEKDAEAGLPVYPGGRTRAEWQPIAEASFKRAEHLPED